ncbi:helix-turn-helix domain-containing protein [Mammaliicoccus sciuri]|uniref:helix-turn-helix domain-containing protein n=1 Tax=Mammaliicoccus sciuri TaxID=1296 RepID=UPI001952BB2D|nr:helix-turn-helix transcriptional regulator [Mammaliicoccus sciuri]WQK74148.1 helix-turn-helix transcriptional regulator [Mammaliicoccus sciuri]
MKNNFSVILGMKKLRISDVHKDTGISRTTLHTLYTEKNNNPDTKTVMKLCEYFDITPNDFFDINNKEDSDNAKNKTTTITN